MKEINFPANTFDEFLIASVKHLNKRLVFADGEDIRTAIAARELIRHTSSHVTLLGSEKVIKDNIAGIGLSSERISVIEPSRSEILGELSTLLQKIFNGKNKQLSGHDALEMAKLNNYYAVLMLKSNQADGGVSGSLSSTEDMIKPAIQIMGTGVPKKFISAASIQIFPRSSYGLNGKFLFADIAIIPEPDRKQMVDIITASNQTAKTLFDGQPRIAVLSYSTKGSARSERIGLINDAIQDVKEIDPGIKVDGELQFDAAVDPEAAKAKRVGGQVAGRANVLIFPNLDAANNSL